MSNLEASPAEGAPCVEVASDMVQSRAGRGARGLQCTKGPDRRAVFRRRTTRPCREPSGSRQQSRADDRLDFGRYLPRERWRRGPRRFRSGGTSSRGEVRIRLPADPGPSAPAGAGQLRHHAPGGAPAGVRGPGPRRRTAHPRRALGGHGPRGPGRGVGPGLAAFGPRAGQGERRRDHRPGGRLGRVLALRVSLPVGDAADDDRGRDDGRGGGVRHADPYDGGRGQAGSGDGVLRGGVPGRRPVREPAGRVSRRDGRRPRRRPGIGIGGARRQSKVRHRIRGSASPPCMVVKHASRGRHGDGAPPTPVRAGTPPPTTATAPR